MSRPVRNLLGMAFGRWKVIAAADRNPKYINQPVWRVVCTCGNERSVLANALLSGKSLSCGCYMKDMLAARGVKHGLARTTEYQVWAAMRHRCLNPKSKAYPNYGGRGITICDRWLDVGNFVADMGPKPSPDHSIDRIDNDGPYCKENCRWATTKVQNDNRSISRSVTYKGVTKSVYDWSLETGIKYTTIIRRLDDWMWSVERTLTQTPKSTKEARTRNLKGQYA